MKNIKQPSGNNCHLSAFNIQRAKHIYSVVKITSKISTLVFLCVENDRL